MKLVYVLNEKYTWKICTSKLVRKKRYEKETQRAESCETYVLLKGSPVNNTSTRVIPFTGTVLLPFERHITRGTSEAQTIDTFYRHEYY